jgi:DNA polymerase III epsilon subunit-like protein
VDDAGRLILDTLVDPDVEITYSCVRIHGIEKDWLKGAPSVEQVRGHILKICSGSVFIGHGVKTDLKVLMLGEVDYIDTGFFLD